MDIASLVDPEISAVLAELKGLGPLDDELLVRMRRFRDKEAVTLSAALGDEVERTEVTVPGAPGDPDVMMRIHRPRGASGALPCVYWMHGGGYVLGNALGDDPRFDRWCRMFNCVGVSVEYRLAPETPYPGPLEDAYAGLKWVHANAKDLGIDSARIGISGISGGGGLATALGLLTRDRAEVPMAFQLLIYPMIDDRLTSPSSTWDVPVWPRGSNIFGWKAYLGDLFGRDDVPAHAAPARETNHGGLPPTFVMVGALDGFLDEDVHYAHRLNQAGVPTELHVYPGAPHGFELFAPGARVSKQAVADTESWLGRQLA